MSRKTVVWTGAFLGGTLGSFAPLLWGASLISMAAILMSGLGGLAGIWLALKLTS